jgi:hypothetical protein
MQREPVFGEILGGVHAEENGAAFGRDAKNALGIRREQIAPARITFELSPALEGQRPAVAPGAAGWENGTRSGRLGGGYFVA